MAPLDERQRWKRIVVESRAERNESIPPDRHRLEPAIANWVQRRGKPMMALFGFLGTVGSLFAGGVAGYLHYAPDPHENRLAKMEELLRTVAENNRLAMFTVGGMASRVEKLETSDKQHGEQLASLRPVVQLGQTTPRQR